MKENGSKVSDTEKESSFTEMAQSTKELGKRARSTARAR